MAASTTRKRKKAIQTRERDETPRFSKSMRQQAELWTEFFNLALEKLLEDQRGSAANRNAVLVAGDVADKALEVYEERWPGVYL